MNALLLLCAAFIPLPELPVKTSTIVDTFDATTATTSSGRIVWLWDDELAKLKRERDQNEKLWVRAQLIAEGFLLQRDECQEELGVEKSEVARLKQARINDSEQPPATASQALVPWAIGAGLVAVGVVAGLILGEVLEPEGRPP